MYLSRIRLNKNKRKTVEALNNPRKFHGALESSFTEFTSKRKLWRVDELESGSYILLLSEDKPDLKKFSEQFGYQNYDNEVVTKEYSVLLNKLENNSLWKFRLAACPVICKSWINQNGSEEKYIMPCKNRQTQKQWLLKRCLENGFYIDENLFDVISDKTFDFKKNGDRNNRVTFISAVYEGILKITDKEKFSNSLLNGIGKEKAYGMGLLTIMRP